MEQPSAEKGFCSFLPPTHFAAARGGRCSPSIFLHRFPSEPGSEMDTLTCGPKACNSGFCGNSLRMSMPWKCQPLQRERCLCGERLGPERDLYSQGDGWEGRRQPGHGGSFSELSSGCHVTICEAGLEHTGGW